MLGMAIRTLTPVKAPELVGASSFDMQFVLPCSEMIVGVGEMLARTLRQGDEEHTVQVGIPAVISPTEGAKAVKVLVLPPKGSLDHLMHSGQHRG